MQHLENAVVGIFVCLLVVFAMALAIWLVEMVGCCGTIDGTTASRGSLL